jgi:hypothetical protein
MGAQTHANDDVQTDELTWEQIRAVTEIKRKRELIESSRYDHEAEVTLYDNGTATITLTLAGIDAFAAMVLEKDTTLPNDHDNYDVVTHMCGALDGGEGSRIVLRKTFM